MKRKQRSNLYRTIYLSDMGYVVYRHCFDERKCSEAEGARAHRQATFVCETDALEYCHHRNTLIDQHGDDCIGHVLLPGEWDAPEAAIRKYGRRLFDLLNSARLP